MARLHNSVAISPGFDVFRIRNGRLTVTHSDLRGGWQGPIGIGPFHQFADSEYTSVATSPQYGTDQTDIFAVGDNGQLQVFWGQGGDSWQGPVGLGPTDFFPPGAPLCASPQYGVPDQTDVFLVGNDGRLYVFWVHGGGTWQGPMGLGPADFFPRGAVVVASPQYGVPNQTDVFAVGNDGRLYVCWIHGEDTWYGPMGLGPSELYPAGAGVAVSPQDNGRGQTDVFVIGNNGQLYVTWIEGEDTWLGPVGLGPTDLYPAGGAIATTPQYGVDRQYDVFIVGKNGQLYVNWVVGGDNWQGPVGLGPVDVFPAGAALAATPEFNWFGSGYTSTDVLGVGNNGVLQEFRVDLTADWTGPIAATDIITGGDDRIDFDFPSITFDNGVPVGGFAHLTLFKSGNCRFTGHFHDSGATEYNMATVFTVQDSEGTLYTSGVQGHVSGTFQSGSRDFDWDQNVQDDQVAKNWPAIEAGCRARVHSSADGDLVNLTNTAIGAAGLVLGVVGLFGSGSDHHGSNAQGSNDPGTAA
ncbi:hypothetical protein ACFWF7_28840 [Nocardia sp. NPDC060256]|uniref:hypothetical protein n=1 Tax=unclassified Nocardia TaxID=2637762 RepID=UPI003658A570